MSDFIHNNAIQAIFAYYDADNWYDTLFAAPVRTADRRRALLIAGGVVAGIAGAGLIQKAWRRAAHTRQIEARIRTARARRQYELDAVKNQLANNPVNADTAHAINTAINSEGPLAVFHAIRNGRFRLSDVVRVYQRRCLSAQELYNPITHMLVNAAGEAAALEKKVLSKEEGQTKMPPLYGLVVSVKEMYGVEGTDSTSGISKRLHHYATKDSTIVKTMREMGAVVICKTNFPQTLFSFASSNPIYGVSLNPHDPTRGPGGSSSGEAVLQALNCSMLGWGSDIGGSVRIPAHFCGVAAFKPTNDRFDGRGVLEVIMSSKAIISTYGMLSRDVRLIALVHATLLQPDGIFKHDPMPLAPPLPWRDELYTGEQNNLRIGYFLDDGYCPSTPGVQRAVKMAVKLLADQGHTLVPFQVPDPWHGSELCAQLYGGDRWRDLYEILQHDAIDPAMQPSFDVARIVREGSWIRKQYALFTSYRLSKRMFVDARAQMGIKTPEDLSRAIVGRDAYRARFLEECMKLKLDLLLSPVVATPALKLGDEARAYNILSYTERFNLLNLPAGTVTVTQENATDQKLLEDAYPETNFLERLVKQSVRGATGLPLGVQIISCNPSDEELCLKVMTQLQQQIVGAKSK